jgi:hypothetical protein
MPLRSVGPARISALRSACGIPGSTLSPTQAAPFAILTSVAAIAGMGAIGTWLNSTFSGFATNL